MFVSPLAIRCVSARAIMPIAVVALLLVLAPLTACAQAEDTKAWHTPTRQPDRIMLGITPDPSTSMSVNWRTSTDVSSAKAELAEAEDGPDFTKRAKETKATSQPLKTDINEAHFHTVQFTGLKPDTLYVYRVGDGKNWSEWNQFRTAAAGRDPLTFIYVGDAQNNIYSMWSRVIRAAYSSAPDTRFILHAGDLINRRDRDGEWGEWFYGAGWINSKVPIVAVPGNHEYGSGPTGDREVSTHWRPQFALPENGPKGLEETCYYADIQGLRVIGLNSNVMQKKQAEWLETVLTNNPNKWTILTFHHPIFSASRGRDNKSLRELWKPIFDKYKVDMVLTGHDHTYGRSNLVSGNNVRADSGTVYVVSVSGPKMYSVDQQEWMERSAGRTQLYQVIRIDGDKLSYESRTARGVLYDAFDLVKEAGKPNRLINKVPNTPARGNDETQQ
ncbi:MAG: metallophosphoesterase family protein [Bryobacterales bacterium]|jgi:phosphodiesterase/alkaline phosphatase D-like protein|nr:metallophosphoesterase family protein [Bryobacterales bacterium]